MLNKQLSSKINPDRHGSGKHIQNNRPKIRLPLVVGNARLNQGRSKKRAQKQCRENESRGLYFEQPQQIYFNEFPSDFFLNELFRAHFSFPEKIYEPPGQNSCQGGQNQKRIIFQVHHRPDIQGLIADI